MPRWLPLPIRRFLSSVLHYPTKSVADDAVEGRIRAEQINNIKRYLTSMMLANACNAAVLVIALWSSSQRQWALAWASTILLVTIYHGLKSLYSPNTKPSYGRPGRSSGLFAMPCCSAVSGRCCLCCSFKASAGGQVIIACLCAGMLGGGAFAFASIPAAAIAFTTPIVIGSAIAIGRSGETAHILVSVLMVSCITVLLKGVCRFSADRDEGHRKVQAERRVRRDELTALPNRLAFY